MRRHKIDILQQVSGYDDYGEPTNDWQPFKANLWATKYGITGKDFYAALTSGEKVDAKFETGYFPGSKSTMRLKHGIDEYEIIGPPIDVEDKHLKLLFHCKLVV